MSPQENKKCLIVVANRLPFVLKRNPKTGKLERKASAGGLVTAVAPVVIQGKGMWVGWPGIHLDNPDEPIPESDPTDTTPTAGLLSKQVVVVIVDSLTLDLYYNGCCNATFWPLFHSMPGRTVFLQETWKAYCTVNQIFADRTLFALKSAKNESRDNAPIVWVHDYHLMLASNWIRQAMERSDIQCKLAFFLHTPFPSWDIFRLLPWCDEILQGMLSCDLVGFHIEDYCINFVDCCQRQLGCRVNRKDLLVEYGGRAIIIRPLPIGIPYDRFVKMAEVAPKVLQISEKIVLGVDRLDYTKGLVHRLKTFEKLLEVYPEHCEKVKLLQISVPSRTDVKEYKDLKEEMDQLVGRINGSFTTYNWSPIRYIYGCVSQDELAAFYRDAAVCLVTPLRDGMNLVAKEFVACQINPSPGVLIVSSFAGAAETMPEALICNPYEINSAADILNRALTMPEDERILRMTLLRRREKLHDVDYWMNSFLKAMGALKDDVDESIAPSMAPVTMEDFDGYLSTLIDSHKKLALLLDYDGTLAPLASHPDEAILPKDTKEILERLSKMTNLFMAVVSGRAAANVKAMVGIAGLTYAGNHGHEILFADGKSFVQPLPTEFAEKITTLANELQEKVCKDGAWVENKQLSLTYHYRETPMHVRQKLIAEAQTLIERYGLKAGPAHCAIEVKPPVQWNKGRACLYILKSQFGANWADAVSVIYVGDDVTDEDAMEALKGMAATFRVTSSTIIRTAAQRRLSNTQSVLTLLKWVERFAIRGKPGTS